jgi:transcriptional regulator with XRE-family HTH domain
MSEINEKIKEMRQRRGLTLLEVAEHLGVKEATVQRYESGNIKNIKHKTIYKLADLFKCDPCYLMG